MSQTNGERELLIKQIAEARDSLRGFRRKTIYHLSHDLDTVEQGVKSIEATGRRSKIAYKRYHTKLKEINTNILHLRAKRGAWYFRGARIIAVFLALLFLLLYILAGFIPKTVPTTLSDAIVWWGIGIAFSVINYLNFILLFDIFITLTVRLPAKFNPGKPTLLEKLYSSVICYLLIYAYFNTAVLLFSFTQSWAYPYLRNLLNGILQGDILPRIYAFLTIISTIVGLIGGTLGIIEYFQKRWSKKPK